MPDSPFTLVIVDSFLSCYPPKSLLSCTSLDQTFCRYSPTTLPPFPMFLQSPYSSVGTTAIFLVLPVPLVLLLLLPCYPTFIASRLYILRLCSRWPVHEIGIVHSVIC
jgi:hypothetical protein